MLNGLPVARIGVLLLPVVSIVRPPDPTPALQPHYEPSSLSGRRRRARLLSRWPPSAAQTGRAVFPHPAFTKTQLAERQWKGSSRLGSQAVLTVELTAWQRFPTAAAPLAVPMRPDPPHQPSVEPVEELSDVGQLVVVAPTTHDGIDLLYQLLSAHGCVTPCEPTNLLLEVVDRFLSGISIKRSPSGTRLDLACRQVHRPASSLDLVSEKFEAVPNMHNPRLLRVNGHAQLLQDAACRL